MQLALVLLLAAAPPLFPACQEPGKCGFISKTGAVVIPFKLRWVEPFHEASADALAGAGLDDKSNTRVFIDRAGKVAVTLPPEVEWAWEWSEERGRVEVAGPIRNGERQRRFGFVDRTGKLVIAADFEAAMPFTAGLAHVALHRTHGYIDPTGKMVIALGRKSGEEFASDLGKVSDYDKFIAWFIDKTGKRVLGPYSSAESFSEGLAAATEASGGTCSYIDPTGKVAIRTKWKACSSFSSGIAAVGELGGPWGYINKKGALILPITYKVNYSFYDGRARFDNELKCGYMDPTGAKVIKAQFDHCDSFSSGLARVRLNDASAYIDNTGRVVWKALPAAK